MKKILFLFSFSLVFFHCKDPQLTDSPVIQVFPFPESGGFVDLLDPGEPGSYQVCTGIEYAETGSLIQQKPIKLFVPAFNGPECITSGQFDLVLIAHADGAGVSFDATYDSLAEHLASHGFMVGVFERGSNFQETLEAQLHHLYNISSARHYLTDDIALIGHSAGGRLSIENAQLIPENGKNLRALILFAPSMPSSDTFIDLENVTSAFLGIHVATDDDSSTFGSKAPGQPMRSTFKYYDNAGVQLAVGDPIPYIYSLEKDMLYVYCCNHFFQNNLFALAYTNAFLQLHLRGNNLYRRFFKLQERPPNIDHAIVQQHHDRTRLVVADFENNNPTIHALGGAISVIGTAIEDLEVGNAYELDEFSPHDTRVMMFDWAGIEEDAPSQGITFTFDEPMDVSEYRYLSFRMTQVYHPEENPEGGARNFEVALVTAAASASVSIAEVAEPLAFPTQVLTVPSGIDLEEQTKNAMRSYIIRLTDFEDIDMSSLEEVQFRFNSSGADPSIFMLDDLEFYLLQ